MTKIELWNLTDLGMAERGLISAEAVRKVSLDALVDTGAITLVIPEDVATKLGLTVLQVSTVTLADGTQRQVPFMGAMRLEILGRHMTIDAYVTPAGSTPLIGQIPLEALDLIVDPGSREVRVRSEDGPKAYLLRVAA